MPPPNGQGSMAHQRGGGFARSILGREKWHGHLGLDRQTSSAGCRCHGRIPTGNVIPRAHRIWTLSFGPGDRVGPPGRPRTFSGIRRGRSNRNAVKMAPRQRPSPTTRSIVEKQKDVGLTIIRATGAGECTRCSGWMHCLLPDSRPTEWKTIVASTDGWSRRALLRGG